MDAFLLETLKYAWPALLVFIVNELRARQRKRTMLSQIDLSKARSESEMDQKYQQYFFETTRRTSDLLIQLEHDRQRLIEERNRDTMLKAQMNLQLGELSEKVKAAEAERLNLTNEIVDLKRRADDRHRQIEEQTAREVALNQTLLDVQTELQRCREERDQLKGGL